MVLQINYVKLGKFLQQKRQESGLSQNKVAKKLGYTTPQFVSNWERGVINPPIETLAILPKLYNFDKKELVKFLEQEIFAAIRKEI